MSKHAIEIVTMDRTYTHRVDAVEPPIVILDQAATGDLRSSLSMVLSFSTAEILVSLLGYPPIIPRDDD